MATILACIRASPLALRPLRPLACVRSYSHEQDGDGTGSPPGRKKQTLDELLQNIKIQRPVKPLKLESVKPQRKTVEKVPDLDTKTTLAAAEAAEALPGDVDQNMIDLIGQLREVSKESRQNLADLLTGMRIDRSDPRITDPDGRPTWATFSEPSFTRHGGARRSLASDERESRKPRTYKLFPEVEQRLGIFSTESLGSGTSLPIWDQLQEKELKLMLTTSPRNGFEEMIRWTEEGKLWPFPINNEYGMLEEADVSFEDHVFLDHLIDDDNAFPPGPVKQFMELVCVGLSKNPYISVERKHRCIEWYRDYLTSKKKLIEAALES